MRIDCAVQRRVRFFPGEFHELIARVASIRLLDQHFEQTELVTRELQRRSMIPNLATLIVDRERRSSLRRWRRARIRSAQDRLDPRRQFPRREWLYHIIVRADLEA